MSREIVRYDTMDDTSRPTTLRNIDDIRNDEGAYQWIEKSMTLDTAKAHTLIITKVYQV